MNDFDYIKNKFDNDGLLAPDELNEGNVTNKLNRKPKPHKTNMLRAFVGAAACFILVVATFAIYQLTDKQHITSDNNTLAEEYNLSSFNSYNEIFTQMQRNTRIAEKFEASLDYYVKDEASGTAQSNDINDDFGKTYVQYEGIDEGDTVKNDGKYIYIIDSNSESVKIFDGERLVSEITDLIENDDFDSYGYSDLSDLYVYNNLLIVNISSEIYNYNEYNYERTTHTIIYDTSDKSSPQLVEDFSQSGLYLTSRLIDTRLYIVSSMYDFSNINKPEDCYIKTAVGSDTEILDANEIYYGKQKSNNSYTIISCIDIGTCKRLNHSKAIFASSTNIYCNMDNMYLTSCGNNSSQIIKVSLGEDIEFCASATIKGYINNQFSLDERNGYLRVASSDNKANSLFILDENMNIVSNINGFAKDEQIKAVRYIGDMAYVITYEETDPLFVIDLSDPFNPEIKGSVEITGFSSQLVPIDENRLLGIGNTDSGWLKLVLFDVSNPSSPSVIDSLEFETLYSESQYNHKAICVNEKRDFIAIDFTDNSSWLYYSDDEKSHSLGCITIKVIDDKLITEMHKASCYENDDFAQRVTYISDTFYLISYGGNVYKIDL